MHGRDLIMQTLLGGGAGSSGGGSSSGIPQADIDAAFDALAEKGVTVPDGATSADLDDLIASIVTGGGDDVKLTSGTVLFAEQTTIGDTLETAYTVEHNLGELPDIFVFAYAANSSYGNSNHLKLFFAIRTWTQDYPFYAATGDTPSGSSKRTGTFMMYDDTYFGKTVVTDTYAKVVGATSSTIANPAYGNEGTGYRWVAIKYRT